jgi:anthranilate phosphoribosyltransferase
LDGEPGPYRDIVLLNAAGALMAADKTPDGDWRQGVATAVDAIDSGRAKRVLAKLIAVSNRA